MVFEWFEWPKQNRVTYVRSEWTYGCGSCAAVWYVLRCCLLCGSAECVCCLIRSSAKAIDLLHSVCQKLIELMTSAIDLCGIQMSATDENCWKNCWQSFTPLLPNVERRRRSEWSFEAYYSIPYFNRNRTQKGEEKDSISSAGATLLETMSQWWVRGELIKHQKGYRVVIDWAFQEWFQGVNGSI